MGKILLVNGSPRAPRSNSLGYARLLARALDQKPHYRAISRKNHAELAAEFEKFSDVVLIFPLYADGIPVSLLNFLKVLETYPVARKPVLSVLINCGFYEPRQNDVAVEMIRLFCRQNGYAFGSVLEIGSGEAILDTPFKGRVARKIRRFARSVQDGEGRMLQVTMPIPRRLFVRASAGYWTRYGERNGISREAMATMAIEGDSH